MDMDSQHAQISEYRILWLVLVCLLGVDSLYLTTTDKGKVFVRYVSQKLSTRGRFLWGEEDANNDEEEEETPERDPRQSFLSAPVPFSRATHSRARRIAAQQKEKENADKESDGVTGSSNLKALKEEKPSASPLQQEMVSPLDSTEAGRDGTSTTKDTSRKADDRELAEKVVNKPHQAASGSASPNHSQLTADTAAVSHAESSSFFTDAMSSVSLLGETQSMNSSGALPSTAAAQGSPKSSSDSKVQNTVEKNASPSKSSTDDVIGNSSASKSGKMSSPNAETENSTSTPVTTPKGSPSISTKSPTLKVGKKKSSSPLLLMRAKSESTPSIASSSQEQMCSICMCELEDGELIRTMPECEHIFHSACLEKWARTQGVATVCPMCRKNCFLDEGSEENSLAHLEANEVREELSEEEQRQLIARARPLADSLGVELVVAALTIQIQQGDK